jgi:pyruvate kinase
MPRTKIVCTIGPSSSSPEVIRELIQNGMDVARLNFSHGTHQEHEEKIHIIRTASEELGKPVAILQDLCGPKIRVGRVAEPGMTLKPGQTFILTSEQIVGSENRVSVSYPTLPSEVKKGDIILLADGMLELVVKKTNRTEIHCKVITGGVLTSHKGINLPSGTIKADALTPKDMEDLLFGLKNDVDYVGLSFVRRAEDILKLKDIMEVSDGVMVARGDLGVEIPLEDVPNIQKMLVCKANVLGKPVIIATQMLRSMVDSPRPTRAEATDVANGVLDGADAVMLSEETAIGKYPVKAVQFMARIAESAEKIYPYEKYLQLISKKGISESVAYASCILADNLDASAIVATTRSGFTAKHISRFRPKTKIIALSPDKVTVRRLSLYWGCLPSFVPDSKDTDDLFEKTSSFALATGNVSKGDVIVITTGHPVWVAGTTNMMRVKRL